MKLGFDEILLIFRPIKMTKAVVIRFDWLKKTTPPPFFFVADHLWQTGRQHNSSVFRESYFHVEIEGAFLSRQQVLRELNNLKKVSGT